MAIGSAFLRFYNFLANLGLVLRDDPPKVVDLTGREWGATVNGLALSIRQVPKHDPEEQAVLSVVIRNAGRDRKTFIVPGWLFFYEVEITAQNGAGVSRTFYGDKLLTTERKTERLEVSLDAGEARDTDVPLGALYAMRRGDSYRVRVLSKLDDRTEVTSNEIAVRA
ncbi:MAG TPA: hypothetical protein VK789_26350 [Bryobacteraceae bacterium]|nr:hypothetical protein [Bryobacteraceae bacterium]